MDWDPKTLEKFKVTIARLPVFHRRIAEAAVIKKAEQNAGERKAKAVQEEDVVSAFFSDVPTPFYSMMIRLLEHSEFDYKKYGFPKNGKS